MADNYLKLNEEDNMFTCLEKATEHAVQYDSRKDGMYTAFMVTPSDWECLDGTFYVENDIPYIVFSHEWTQVGDGEIWAMELSNDLKKAVSEPFMLFRASDNPNVSELNGHSDAYVTDGPFLYEEDGKLNMIWSSFYRGRYLVLHAWSESLKGEWHHGGSRFDFDGGHAMLFHRLNGERMISLHSPNVVNMERAMFFQY